MKKYSLIFLILLSLFACEKDKVIFEATSEGLEMKFKPLAGGALLEYKLPRNVEIFSMNIRYKNERGDNILKTCGYSGKDVMLDGFNQAQDVTAKVTFANKRGEETEPFDYHFSTLNSAPWDFFEGIKVGASWNGFEIIYDSVSVASGKFHIFYLGKNKYTQKIDTIPVRSLLIKEKGETLRIPIQQTSSKNTVVIRTEDSKGNRVRQEIYRDIESFNTEFYPIQAEQFIAPVDEDGNSLNVEHTIAHVGLKYLFDREINGRWVMDPVRVNDVAVSLGGYVAGPYAVGKPFIIDLKEERVPARVSIYTVYPTRMISLPIDNVNKLPLGHIWKGAYYDKLPNSVTIYGGNSANPEEGEWKELGSYTQDRNLRYKDSWAWIPGIEQNYPKTLIELEERAPLGIDLVCPPINERYRYIKMVVNDTFATWPVEYDYNQMHYFTMQELEVYVKKDL